MANRHKWTRDDDIVALYLARHGDRNLPMDEASIASKLGLKASSLAMRKSNFKYVEGGAGLANAAAQSILIAREFRTMGEEGLRKQLLDIISC